MRPILQNLVQKVLPLVVILGLTSFGLAGPKATGPANGQPGDLIKIKITEFKDLNDPKVICTPENEKWEVIKNLDGDLVIIFATKDPGIYNFTIAGNKENKTYLAGHAVQIGNNPIPPPGPGPVPPGPVPGKYSAELRPIYMVSPNKVALSKLITVYRAVGSKASSMTTWKNLELVLVNSTKEVLAPTDLSALRTATSEILQRDLTNRGGVPYDAAKAAIIFEDLAKSLEALESWTQTDLESRELSQILYDGGWSLNKIFASRKLAILENTVSHLEGK